MSKVKTLTDVKEIESAEAQQLRLRLILADPPSYHRKKAVPLKRARQWATAWIEGSGKPELEQSNDPAATERNERQLEEIFSNMHEKVEKQKVEAIKEVQKMNKEEQETLMSFWKIAGKYFDDVMNWLKEMFKAVVEKIKEGFRLVKEVIEKIFQEAKDFLKIFFI